MNQILIVDDEQSIRDTARIILQRAGFSVDTASDALSAIELLEAGDYDVILTDIIMPRMSGIELLSRIRRKSMTVQVLIMTGEPTFDTAMQAVKHGASDYLAKPIDKETLLIAVRQAMQIKQLHDEKRQLEEERVRYLHELETIVDLRTRELQESMQSIMLLFSSVTEIRDPYTAGHQRRVGNLSAAIAERMQSGRETVNILLIAGYLHDIGKMFVPAEILNKPGRLNELEMGLIRAHPHQGYDMLSRVYLPKVVSEIIYQHHERLNGSGYPRGLDSRQILPEASVLAVADVVEAMMSHRPYRAALGLDAALDEILRSRGVLYHPDVVDACVSLFQDERYVIDDREYRVHFP